MSTAEWHYAFNNYLISIDSSAGENEKYLHTSHDPIVEFTNGWTHNVIKVDLLEVFSDKNFNMWHQEEIGPDNTIYYYRILRMKQQRKEDTNGE